MSDDAIRAVLGSQPGKIFVSVAILAQVLGSQPGKIFVSKRGEGSSTVPAPADVRR